MFEAHHAGKYVEYQTLQARPCSSAALWLGRSITILSGR